MVGVDDLNAFSATVSTRTFSESPVTSGHMYSCQAVT